MFPRSLRARLIVTFIGLSIVPLFIVGAAIGWQSFRLQQRQAIALQREISERASSQITTFLENADLELHLLIQTPDLKKTDQVRQQQVLAQALFYKNIFEELALLDAQGRELARATRLGVVDANSLQDRSASDEFRFTLQRNATYVGPVSRSPLNDEVLLLMAVPSLDTASGQPSGALVGMVRLSQVLEKVVSIPVGDAGVISVVANGTVIAHRDPQVAAQAIQFVPPPNDGLAVGVRGTQAVVTTQALGQGAHALAIVAELPLHEALQPALEIAGVAAALLLLASLIALVLGLAAVRHIVRPISQLAVASQAISAGDLSQQVPVSGSDEVGTLQREFNQMVANLRQQRDAIEQRNSDLQASVDTQKQLLRTIAELSTPLLPVWEGVVVLPVVGHVDSRRGQEILQALVQGVATKRARVAILDVTGIALVDTQVITLLLQAMRAVELLGAQPMLAGISSTMAQVIVQQGIDLGSLSTHRDLRTATEVAIELLHGSQTGNGRHVQVNYAM